MMYGTTLYTIVDDVASTASHTTTTIEWEKKVIDKEIGCINIYGLEMIFSFVVAWI